MELLDYRGKVDSCECSIEITITNLGMHKIFCRVRNVENRLADNLR